MIAHVTSTAPLLVRERGASTPVPATLLVGSSYTAAVGDRVLIEVDGRKVWVIGGAP